MYRKDVLFYTVQLDKDELKRVINSFDLADETLHFRELGVYWGKHDKTSYNQTVYHKNLLKSSFYSYITIRNARTFSNMFQGLVLAVEFLRRNKDGDPGQFK